MHVGCWIQQVTAIVGAVTCWIQQPVYFKYAVGFSSALNSEVENRFTDVFWTIFGCTELRIGQSRAKNYEQSDFDVRFDVAPPNPD